MNEFKIYYNELKQKRDNIKKGRIGWLLYNRRMQDVEKLMTKDGNNKFN
ncbi:hypothetical protein KC887_02500 [Candidatus Kaiserbacteria bacterium]|nr:hypothetical protein [Candidatus Kaiserbacteria bacterium]